MSRPHLPLLALLLAACSDPPAHCEFGRVQSCPCAGGGTGVQQCAPPGVWSVCACMAVDAGADVAGDAPVDAAPPDAAPSDAPPDDAMDAAPPGDRPAADVGDAPACDADLAGDPRNCGACSNACTTDQTCAAGRCVARVCMPAAASCFDARTRRVCNGDGLGYTMETCPSSGTCVRGACLAVPTDGLVAYYPFNGNANDESGLGGPTGTITRATLDRDRCGRANSAYRFPGASSIVMAPNARLPAGASPRTLAVWVSTTDRSAADYHTIANWGEGVRLHRYGLALDRERALFTAELVGVYATTSPADGRWHLLVVTYDGATVEVSVDGAVEGRMALALDTVRQQLVLGRAVLDLEASALQFYTGLLDDVRVYDRALTPTELTALFNEGGCAP